MVSERKGTSLGERMNELLEEANTGRQGILLLQETWRSTPAAAITLGNWRFFGIGNPDKPKGNGTAIMIHQSLTVTYWHNFALGITAICIPLKDKTMIIFSVYPPPLSMTESAPGRRCSMKPSTPTRL